MDNNTHYLSTMDPNKLNPPTEGNPHPLPKEPDRQPPTRTNYETVFTNYKAGMQGVDAEKVKQVVFEMSKDSAHFINEQRKSSQTEARIAKMKAQLKTLSPSHLSGFQSQVDTKIAELEGSRDLTRTWIHVDMDAFFAAVEERDNPALKGKAFAVGGIGMISTASYAARKFGVRSAMPGFIALKLCPQLQFVPCNFDKYKAASDLTRQVFKQYDPHFEAMSLDEAHLDVTDYCASHHHTNGETVASEIRQKVFEITNGLTCSCGIACNKLLAKIASDQNKPNGQFSIAADRNSIMVFVATLPVRKIPGVGRVTERMLNAFHVENCGDVVQHRAVLAALFSPIALDFFFSSALGLGSTTHPPPPVEGKVGRKGMSCERTFRPLSARGALQAKLRELAEQLSEELKEESLKGKTLTLKLKTTAFELRTRAATVERYTNSSEELYNTGIKLLRTELPIELRLMGLRMSNFAETKRDPGQKSLEEVLGNASKKKKKQKMVDEHSEEEEGNEQEEFDTPHRSQVLSAGDEVELTFHDWDDDDDDNVEDGNDDKRKEDATPLFTYNSALPIPPTQLDAAVQKWRNGSSGNQQQNDQIRNNGDDTGNVEKVQDKKSHDYSVSWTCTACTYDNPKLLPWCEMCGESRVKKKDYATTSAAAAAGNNKNKKKRRVGSILNYVHPINTERKVEKRVAVTEEGGGKREERGEGSMQQRHIEQKKTGEEDKGEDEDEDLIECEGCGQWIRESEYQVHTDGHVASMMRDRK
jgi:DNA polymerase kappa